jgi:hypothetical protein
MAQQTGQLADGKSLFWHYPVVTVNVAQALKEIEII